jgi:hypothetical protein
VKKFLVVSNFACVFFNFVLSLGVHICGGRPSVSRGPDFLQVIILVLLNRAIVSLSTVTMMINRVDVLILQLSPNNARVRNV